MDLIAALIVTGAAALLGGLLLDRVRGLARRAEGQMTRALRGIPDEADRERWSEELRRILSEFEGRPYKQFRESRELIRAAERLVAVYAPRSLALSVGGDGETAEPESQPDKSELEAALDQFVSDMKAHADNTPPIIKALENLSYRERRVLELRWGAGGKELRSRRRIGAKFNLTEERVRDIERVSLEKLTKLAAAERLRKNP